MVSEQLGADNYTNATLPISADGNLHLDSKIARAFGEELSSIYCFAEPFPYIVIDNFLPQPVIEEIYSLFPTEKLADDKFYENGYTGLHKRQVLPESCEQKIRNIFHFFNSLTLSDKNLLSITVMSYFQLVPEYNLQSSVPK